MRVIGSTTEKRCTCQNCGSILEYENADTYIGFYGLKYVKCPVCGAEVAATDLRAAAALVLAGLVSRGIKQVTHLKYLDRGNYRFHEKLASHGAEIKRANDVTNGKFFMNETEEV